MKVNRRHIHAATARALETWAAQKRLAIGGVNQGFAPRSMIEKLRKERDGAGEAWKPTQILPDLYRGDGARVQQIVVTLPFFTKLSLTCNYVFRNPWHVPVIEQLEVIGIGKSEYWGEVYAGEIAVESGFAVLDRVSFYRSM